MIPAGPELDLEVARRVFNHVVLMDGSGPRIFYPKRKMWEDIPHYSTDLALAHRVRQNYRVLGWRFSVNSYVAPNGDQTWEGQCVHPSDPIVLTGTGASMPEAICRAAIKVADWLRGV